MTMFVAVSMTATVATMAVFVSMTMTTMFMTAFTRMVASMVAFVMMLFEFVFFGHLMVMAVLSDVIHLFRTTHCLSFFGTGWSE